MSKDLPLWDDEEADVLIEHRFQYGHILLSLHKSVDLAKRIAKAFGLKKPVGLYERVNADVLEYEQQKSTLLLSSDELWHFIVAELASGVTMIYGPHFLFFNSRRWVELHRDVTGWLLYVTRGDSQQFFYTIFNKGKHYCNACRDSSGIHKLVHAPVDVRLENRSIYRKPGPPKDLTPELVEMIANDAVPVNDGRGSIQFRTSIGSASVKPISVRHFMFKAGRK